MTDFVFSGGVKPGGLTSPTEIRILICYLLFASGGTLSLQELEAAVIGEELVNYFELSGALSTLLEKEHIQLTSDKYSLTQTGTEIAQTLESSLPYSVKERAVNAAIYAMQFNKKQNQNKAAYRKQADGTYLVECSIADVQGPMFSFTIVMPDKLTAEKVKKQFVENGDIYFQTVLHALIGNVPAACDALQTLQPKKTDQEQP